MTAAKRIEAGSSVTMHFTLSIAHGEVAETSRDDEPLRFVVGDGTLLPSLEATLYGLRAGDTQRRSIEAREAYGAYDSNNVYWLERDEFPEGMELEPGLIVGFSTPSGEEVSGTLLELSESSVRVDFNHPLAGHDITFDVEIISVD